jgi:hypothetical protein
MKRVPKVAYTLEFKLEALRRVRGGEAVRKVAREIGVPEQSIRNWGLGKRTIARAASARRSAGSIIACSDSRARRKVESMLTALAGIEAGPVSENRTRPRPSKADITT